jgi:NTE family protein
MSQPIPKVQKALVLQGGGALGAYEAGVFKTLYNRFIKPSNKSFDIVAGVSIGAVNASILVNHVIHNNNRWDQSVETLDSFWDSISSSPTIYDPLSWPLYLLDNNPILKGWFAYQDFFRKALEHYYNFFTESTKIMWQQEWPYIPIWRREDGPVINWSSWKENWREELPYILSYFLNWPDNYGPVASPETVRRYYSWKHFLLTGTPNVYTPFISQPDLRFFDMFSFYFPYNPYSILYRVGNEPLVRTIKNYWYPNAPPIKTSLDAKQPRLLLVSVDIQNGTSTTFDSYEKGKDEDGDAICRTVYGEDKTKYTIEYPEGIGMEHLDTSMAFHLRHKYPELDVKKVGEANSNSRPFWDGIYLSNTPLRELLQAYRDYWVKVRKLEDGIPKLQVFIVDLFPTAEKGTPEGFDEINDRQYDILFHDKTKYDEKVAHMVTDYVNIGKRMSNLLDDAINTIKDADKKKALQKEYHEFLQSKAKSMTRDGKERIYDDLLKGHFEVEVIRIERSEDHNTDIYGKAFDFSRNTIEKLKEEGEKDTENILNNKYPNLSW